MKPFWTHLLAFVAGVVLVVGVYEVRRLAQNTSHAVAVVQGQMAGETVLPPKQQALMDKAHDNPEAARWLALQLAKQAKEADGGLKEQRDKKLDARKARWKAAWDKLTPEQQEAFKLRMAEKAAQKRRQRQRPGQPLANGIEPIPFEGNPLDQGPLDTALPLPPE